MIFSSEAEHVEVQSAPLESYVVRIYRRNLRFPARLTGTVEIVADGSEVRFCGLRELERILGNQQRSGARVQITR